MKILELTSENIKRIKVVHIKPDGSPIVQITGKNGAGKSSVLDSISYAMGGKDLIPEEPIRQGEDHAEVMVDLGDYVITRTFTGGDKTYLTVRTKDGAKVTSPQALLDRLVGKISFDPLAFARREPREQAEILRALVGLDFSDLDTRKREAFEERQTVNRDLKKFEAKLTDLPEVEAPDQPVVLTELMTEYEEAVALKRSNEATRESWMMAIRSEREAKNTVETLTKALEGAREALYTWIEKARTLSVQVDALRDPNLAVLKAEMESAEATNTAVRKQQERKAVLGEVAVKRDRTEALTVLLDNVDQERAGRLAAATFPIKGMAFSPHGVTLHDIPFAQLSSAEQLKVSVAMGLAMNPTVRVILVRDGSLLDEANLQVIAAMAEAADSQVWVERCAEHGGVGVYIEDGEVAT